MNIISKHIHELSNRQYKKARHIIFEIGNYQLVSRLLDGEFLNYKAAIPSAVKTTVNVDTRRLIESIDRTSLIITDKIKSPVKCVIGGDMIKMQFLYQIAGYCLLKKNIFEKGG